MQKAETPEFANTMESIINTPWEESDRKARSAEYFEAWKKVAERRARLIFASVPLSGPTIPDELKTEASDAVLRITWRHACRYMTDEEKIAACRVKSKEIDEYSWALAQKAAAEEWKRVLAAPKRSAQVSRPPETQASSNTAGDRATRPARASAR